MKSNKDFFYYLLFIVKHKQEIDKNCYKNPKIKLKLTNYLKFKKLRKYKNIKKIKRRRNKQYLNDNKIFESLINQLTRLNNKITVKQLEVLLERSDNISNLFLKKILKLNIYLKNKNNFQAIELMNEIIYIPYFYYILNPLIRIDPIFFKKILVSTIDKLNKYITKDESIIFKKHLSFLFPDFIKFDLNLSLSEFREKSQNTKTGLVFASFWVNLLKERVTLGELRKYIQDYFSKLYYFEYISNSYHLLSYLPLIPSKVQYNMIKNYKKFEPLKTIELLQIMNKQNEAFIRTKVLKLKKPLFNFKRDFFTKLINEGRGVDFCLYKLIKLGDLDVKYLLWLEK